MKHFYLILLSTCIIGFMTGVYIFFASRMPTESSELSRMQAAEIEIIADMYGACESTGGCASYIIKKDGSYMYLVRSRNSEGERYEHTVSKRQITELVELIDRAVFETIPQVARLESCPPPNDTAYRFEIRIEGQRSLFDSCKQDVRSEKLFRELIDYFEIFRLTHET